MDDRKTWVSTSPDLFTMGQLLLLKALMLAPSASWDSLWLASLVKPHTVLLNVDSGVFVYVIVAAKHILHVCELKPFRHGWMTFGRDAGSFTYVCVTSLSQYVCWDYGLGLLPEFHVAISPLQGHTMLTYVLLNMAHLLGTAKTSSNP